MLGEGGQASSLSEEELEEVGGEAPAALDVPQTQLLHANTHIIYIIHTRNYKYNVSG